MLIILENNHKKNQNIIKKKYNMIFVKYVKNN